MPLVTVQLWEELLDTDTEATIIKCMTNAVVEALGEQVWSFVTVVVTGVPQRRWGSGGLPASVVSPVERAGTVPNETGRRETQRRA